MTHTPKNVFCDACSRAKMFKKPQWKNRGRKGKTSSVGTFEPSFGSSITADHIIANSEKSRGFSGETCALVLKEHHTKDIASYALKDKTSASALWALSDYVGPNAKVGHVFSDNSPELKAAVEKLARAHGTSTPGEPSTNGSAEFAVGNVMHGTRVVLLACLLYTSPSPRDS